MKSRPQEITEVLRAWREGEKNALDQLIPKIYDELHRIAGIKLAAQPGRVTLQATALVNELYLRYLKGLRPEDQPKWEDRSHFFAIAATVMRRILVDHWRRKQAEKRSEGKIHVTLDEALAVEAQARDLNLFALDQVLNRLQALDPIQVHIVEMRFFAGLTFEEIGRVLQVSDRTVKRKWSAARLWLLSELQQPAS